MNEPVDSKDNTPDAAMLLACTIEDTVKEHLELTMRKEVAELLGLTPQAWSRYVSGETSPTIKTVDGWLTTLHTKGIQMLPPSVNIAFEAWKLNCMNEIAKTEGTL